MNRRQNAITLLALLALTLATPGCGLINKLRAKDTLNEGVREFNKGHYEAAEQKFARALELSPDLNNARLFYARAVNARFDQSLVEEQGLKTIQAYNEIIANNPNDEKAIDTAMAFQANVYNQLAKAVPEKAEEYKQKYRETLLKRADLPSATQQVKADVNYTLGVNYWEEAYALDQQYITKSPPQPIPPDKVEKIRPLVQKAHEYLERAISIDPNYANAYFYSKLAYLQDSYIDPTPEGKKKALAKADEMQKKYLEIQDKQKEQAAS